LPCRLVTVEATEVSRNPGRATDFGPEVEADQPGRGSGGAATGGTAGGTRPIPWVVGPAEHRIAGLHVRVAGRHVGLADDDGPRATQSGDGLSVLRRHVIGQVRPTADRAHTSRLVAVLHGDR